MRRRTILGLGLSCLLGACTHGGYGAVDLGWSLHNAEGEGAKLAYGQPDSDNVLLMMTCRPRSGQVLVSLTAPHAPAAPKAIELSSKGLSSRLPGETAPAMAEGSALVEAMAPASDPTLASFARTGDIAVVENGRASRLPVRQAERAVVADFFAQCRAA
ncbi:MAG: hypothetical protein V4514_06690 [Pseudomonadota bacterium]|uniref:hypothetical protein n=1 Tax=Phenylobacterium sp. TaxID=1871053 RepID=UPI0025F9923D|nr:hypothetical protein [Phenylobacterium sp.]MBT9470445.1 hypothetical protein [Phenylobacterium sp.]